MEGAGMAAESEATFEELLDEAENMAARLENGDLTLDESLRLYEAGVARLRRGSELLAKAEEKLKRLVEDAGGLRLEPEPDGTGPDTDDEAE